MIAAGSQATANLANSVASNKGQFICVVEGAIPTAQNGVFGMVGGKTMLSIAQEIIPQAKVIGGSPAVIAMGTCAAYGGLPAAFPQRHRRQGREGRHRREDHQHRRLSAQSAQSDFPPSSHIC